MTEDEVDPNEVPDVVEQVIQQLGVFVPEHLSTNARAIYSRMLNGECMGCGGELKAQTIAMVSGLGVIGVFCGGQCVSDWQVLGWLREAHDDMNETLNLRGQGVEAHGEPGGDDTDPRDSGAG